LDTPAVEKAVTTNEQGIGSFARKTRESRIDLTAAAGVDHLDLQSHGAGSGLRVSHCGLGIYGIGRIDEHGHASHSRHQFMQEPEPFCHQFSGKKVYSCQVAARAGETRDQTNPDRIFGDEEDDRNRRGCRLGR
jgi:hypothetical protein